MDIQKQISYWEKSSKEDLEAARSLLEKGHFRHSFFFAHLAIEKMLKACVIRGTKEIPPRTHNLARLAELAGLELGTDMRNTLIEFGVYQLEGMYPDPSQVPLDSETARKDFSSAEEILK